MFCLTCLCCSQLLPWHWGRGWEDPPRPSPIPTNPIGDQREARWTIDHTRIKRAGAIQPYLAHFCDGIVKDAPRVVSSLAHQLDFPGSWGKTEVRSIQFHNLPRNLHEDGFTLPSPAKTVKDGEKNKTKQKTIQSWRTKQGGGFLHNSKYWLTWWRFAWQWSGDRSSCLAPWFCQWSAPWVECRLWGPARVLTGPERSPRFLRCSGRCSSANQTS